MRGRRSAADLLSKDEARRDCGEHRQAARIGAPNINGDNRGRRFRSPGENAMTIVGENGLMAEAETLADAFKSRYSELVNELNELLRRKSEKEALIEASQDAIERVKDFKPRINNEFQCPACYVYRKLESPIRPTPQAEDVFRCVTCAMTYPPFSFGVVPPS
jgi:hypothetical protein